MKNIQKHWLSLWKGLPTNLIQYRNGGQADYYRILAILYSLVFLFNLINLVIHKRPPLNNLQYTGPFILAAAFLLSKYRDYADVILDLAIAQVLVIISPMGDLSAVGILFLVFFRIRHGVQPYAVIGISAVSMCLGAIVGEWTIPEIFVIIAGYSFLGFKYYHIVFKQIRWYKTRIGILEDRLQRFGPAGELSDQEIKVRFPFLNDRRINDLRLLASGYTAKEVGYENGVSYSWQTREHARMQKSFGEITGEEIRTTTQLVFTAVKCGIIPVKYITAGLSDEDRW